MRDVLPELMRWWRAGDDGRGRHRRRDLPLGAPATRARRCSSDRAAKPSARCPAAASRGPSTSWPRRSWRRARRCSSATASRDDDAFAVGLTCGGILDVFVETVSQGTFPELGAVADDIDAGRPVAVATVIEHPDAGWVGRRLVVRPEGTSGCGDPTCRGGSLGSGRADAAVDRRRPRAARARAHRDPDLRPGRRAARRGDAGVRRRPRATPAHARLRRHRLRRGRRPVGSFLGYRVTVCDARPVFATGTRFPEADEVVVEWPHRYLAAEVDAGRVDARTVICVLTHDPKFDVPVLEVALRLPEVAYVGAMGSRRTHEERSRGCARPGSARPSWPGCRRRSGSTSAPARPRRPPCRSPPRSSPCGGVAVGAAPRPRRADPPPPHLSGRWGRRSPVSGPVEGVDLVRDPPGVGVGPGGGPGGADAVLAALAAVAALEEEHDGRREGAEGCDGDQGLKDGVRVHGMSLRGINELPTVAGMSCFVEFLPYCRHGPSLRGSAPPGTGVPLRVRRAGRGLRHRPHRRGHARLRLPGRAEAPGPIDARNGTTVTAPFGLEAAADADLVAVPASSSAQTPSAAVVDTLRAAVDRGAWVLSVCSGAFTLGAAGILDGRECTTHWRHAAELAELHPQARVDPDVLYVQDGTVITSAGTAAGIDAALHLVRTELGTAVATRSPDGWWCRPTATVASASSSTGRSRRPRPRASVRCSPGCSRTSTSRTPSRACAGASISPRTFARRFVAETGTTPHQWLTDSGCSGLVASSRRPTSLSTPWPGMPGSGRRRCCATTSRSAPGSPDGLPSLPPHPRLSAWPRPAGAPSHHLHTSRASAPRRGS